LGVKDFVFGSQGSFFVQGTSDRPGSNLYNSFQFNIVPGEIPLVVLRNISITPQIGVDMRAGNPSLGLQVNFKDFFLKSVNFGIFYDTVSEEMAPTPELAGEFELNQES
jgi:hypothetical protein